MSIEKEMSQCSKYQSVNLYSFDMKIPYSVFLQMQHNNFYAPEVEIKKERSYIKK